jgi:hypothetical protein
MIEGAIHRNSCGTIGVIPLFVNDSAEMEKAGIKPDWTDPSSMFSDLPWLLERAFGLTKKVSK